MEEEQEKVNATRGGTHTVSGCKDMERKGEGKCEMKEKVWSLKVAQIEVEKLHSMRKIVNMK